MAERKLQLLCLSFFFNLNFFYLLILERGKKPIDLLFHVLMHLLVDFCMCPVQGLNPQPWLVGMTFSPTELPGQGTKGLK